VNQSQTNAPTVRLASVLEPFQDAGHSPITHWFERRHRHDLAERMALTFERLGDLTGKRGLDIGCGSGHYMAEALRRGALHIMGIDPALGVLELARRRVEGLGLLDQVEFAPGYFPQYTPPGHFDFAIVMGVLDYVAEPAPFLRNLREILTGTAVVSFPSKHWYHTPIRKLMYRLRHCSVYFYDDTIIRSVAKDSGFAVVDIVKLDGAGMDYHVCLRP
jgi:2-polyprenyl-3-methyl-5-hydroxy-6-metoxy-1,4-benzoquinol methylase